MLARLESAMGRDSEPATRSAPGGGDLPRCVTATCMRRKERNPAARVRALPRQFDSEGGHCDNDDPNYL